MEIATFFCNFNRKLTKCFGWTGDYANWSNTQFDLARAALPAFYNCSDKRGDYNTTAESWAEQRTFITDAPALLVSTQPALALPLASALEELRVVWLPVTAGMKHAADPSARFQCGIR